MQSNLLAEIFLNIDEYFHKLINIELLTLKIVSACECSSSGSTSTSCTSNGICSCKSNFSGTKCSTCDSTYYGYPNCYSKLYNNSYKSKYIDYCLLNPFLACNCDIFGSSSTSCSSSGECNCKTGYTGQKCSSCLLGYYKSGSNCYCKIFFVWFLVEI